MDAPRARRSKSSTRESSETTRARLLQAAAEIFAEKGYQQAKIRQICARADANIALINYHFGDKMGLYTAVLEQFVRMRHVEAIRRALDERGTPEQILRGLIRARLRGMAKGDLTDRQFQIFLRELAYPTSALKRVVDSVTRPVYNRALELIGGMLELPATDEKTRLCAHSIMGQVMLYFLAAPVLKELWPGLTMSSKQMDRISDHIADFSLAYLREVRAKREESAGPQVRRGRK